MNSKCRLCGQQKELKESHIIPKFVINWIKKTSATGFLRQAINPNKRIQDGIKKFFLCTNCENLFSKFETYFANNIFYPYLNQERDSFQYDSNLKKFIVSINWRILSDSIDGFSNINPIMGQFAKSAEIVWRDYLLGNRTDLDEFKTHLFFLNYIQNHNDNLPKKFQFYTLRGIDGTIYYNSNLVHVYGKLPMFIMFSTIHPSNLEGWKNTEIFDAGKIGMPQEISYPGFGDFLKSRAEISNKNKLSEREQTRITKTILKDKNRFIHSKSAEVFEAEEMRKNRV